MLAPPHFSYPVPLPTLQNPPSADFFLPASKQKSPSALSHREAVSNGMDGSYFVALIFFKTSAWSLLTILPSGVTMTMLGMNPVSPSFA
jgi:hypothetical protein